VTFETLHFLLLDTGLRWTQTKIWTITFIDYLTERHKTDYNNGFISRKNLKKNFVAEMTQKRQMTFDYFFKDFFDI